MSVDWLGTVGRSLAVAILSLLLTSPFALGLGYLFARHRFRGKALAEAALMAPLVLPPVVTGFVLLHLFSPAGFLGRWLWQSLGIRVPFTLAAAVLAAAVVSFPLSLRGARTGFAGVPRILEEVAASLGHRPRSVFLRVALPLARRGIVTGVVLAGARALGEFGATLVVAGNIPGRTQTIPLAIYQATQLGDTRTGWTLIAIAGLLAVGLVLAASRLERS